MLTRRRAFALVVASGFSLVLAGCSGTPSSPGTVVLTIGAAEDINPDPAGRASPVVLRVYQLAAPAQFQAVDFFQLYDKESPALGADLVAREELTVPPNSTRYLTIPLRPNTQAIGIAAAFRDIDRANWRAVIEVPPTKNTKLKAEVKKLEVSLAKG